MLEKVDKSSDRCWVYFTKNACKVTKLYWRIHIVLASFTEHCETRRVHLLTGHFVPRNNGKGSNKRLQHSLGKHDVHAVY